MRMGSQNIEIIQTSYTKHTSSALKAHIICLCLPPISVKKSQSSVSNYFVFCLGCGCPVVDVASVFCLFVKKSSQSNVTTKKQLPLPQKPYMYDLCTVFTKKLQGNLGPKQAINPSKNSLNVLVLCFSGIKDVVVGLKQYFLANYGKQNR